MDWKKRTGPKTVHFLTAAFLLTALFLAGSVQANTESSGYGLTDENAANPKMDVCSHSALGQAAFYNPNTLKGILAYRRDGDWSYLTLGEVGDYLVGEPLALDCTSYSLADGTIRTMLSYIGMNKDKGFGVYAYELDFPVEGGPTARFLQSPIFTHSNMLPPVDVAAGDVAYDIKAGRILAAVVRGKRFGYFTLKASEAVGSTGLSQEESTWKELEEFDKEYSASDEDKPQVSLSVNQTDEHSYIAFTDPSYNSISYWNTAEGFLLQRLLENNSSRPIIATAANENGQVTTYIGTPPDKGLWALWRDANGQIHSHQISDQQVVSQSVTRYTYDKDYIVVAYAMESTDEGAPSDAGDLYVCIIDSANPSDVTTTKLPDYIDTSDMNFKVEVRSYFGSPPEITVGHTVWNDWYSKYEYEVFEPLKFP